ncbi:MAG: valine--tRNA ligase [Planctomycetaceae bacterium]|nr:valine--tRNA ligase [Planctomycetaceae bacterium]
MTEIPRQYEPAEAQSRWFPFWEERGDFHAEPGNNRPPHTIMMPLPNVTGALHMGHALNGTLQDLITRLKRMQGCEALWMPGTDHAGIATQAVVERRMLEEEGLTRRDIGREALVNRIWRWKDAYETRIVEQQKQLGSSCDWRRMRFTLDDVCSKAVRRTFFQLFCDGLIYRGKRLVNWDTYLQTAVADDEVFHEDVAGHFWKFNYPVLGEDGQPSGESISFSTTRPETMLGDTAICVHPSDERYRHLQGRKVRIPVNGREIPIIADALLADPELGTGAVKVTPAHDPNDYQCGMRNDLPMINILNPDGTLNENCGQWEGIDRLQARPQIVAEMERLGHLEAVEERQIPLMHSDRSKTPIEPFLSDQWFVKMDSLAQSAMDAVEDGRVKFFPARYSRTYLDWLGEKRDWCISRQLWWGHRIPIWSRVAESRTTVDGLEILGAKPADDGASVVFADEYASVCSARFVDGLQKGETLLLVCVDSGQEQIEQQLEAAGFTRDEDVLDTWFSSALWPHATLGWPDRDRNPPLAGVEQPETGRNEVLETFYPGSVLITSRDIITLWVARMVLMGLYNMGDVPFQHVHVHPKILDGFGQTMSKSRGNGVDPLDLIDRYGTDAVRFTIASFAGETQDVRLPISYECPGCQELIPSKLYRTAAQTIVVPETLQGEFPVPHGAPKPTLTCPKCKQVSQFSTPLYDADSEEPVARMVSERFEYGRNFCNKLWNACRFALLNLEGYTTSSVSQDELHLEDRWILSRLEATATEMTALLAEYQFDAATRAIREFTWSEFCDWYLEMIKPRLRDESLKPAAQRVLVTVLDALVRLLQPFTPFLCEEIWQRLRELAPERGLPQPQQAAESVMYAAWPAGGTSTASGAWLDPDLEQRFQLLQETIAGVRNLRSQYNIPPGTPLNLLLRCDAETAGQMESIAGQFVNLAKATLVEAGPEVSRPAGAAGFSLGEIDGFIPLEGVIDREAELERQQKEAEKLQKFIAGSEKKLSNENFTGKAPADVVEQVRETLAGNRQQLESVQRIIADLQAGQ